MPSPEKLEIPPVDVIGYFSNASGNIANAPTPLAGSEPEPDPQAIYSLLQYGAIIPPCSPWKTVSRLLPGYRYTGSNPGEPIRIPGLDRRDLDTTPKLSAAIVRLLDQILIDTVADGPHPVVLFSGGVDSGLIASRLSTLGYSQSLLMNYAFDPVDPESLHAESMAKSLGLRFVRVAGWERDTTQCLREPGRFYKQPFNDSSVGSISQMADAVIEHLQGEPRPVLDGSGTGIFSAPWRMVRWKQALRTPPFIRRLASGIYSRAMWDHSRPLELQFRILRRLWQMPVLSATAARNPLAGILYEEDTATGLPNQLERWIGGWAGETLIKRVVGAYAALWNAAIYTQNGLQQYQRAGLSIHFPFLETEMLGLALASAECQPTNVRKGALKLALNKHVPEEMVYRPRSGFADQKRRQFYRPDFLEYLAQAVEPGSPISGLLIREKVLKSHKLIREGKRLPRQTLNALWGITFVDRWYKTAR